MQSDIGQMMGEGGIHVDILSRKIRSNLGKHDPPHCVILAVGGNDLATIKDIELIHQLKDSINMQQCHILYNDILPRRKYDA